MVVPQISVSQPTPGGVEGLQAVKLADGAQQFEAMMLQQMLEPMHFGAAPGDDDQTAGAADTVRGLETEALSKAVARAGGFGVARQIVRQVTAEHEANDRKLHRAKV